MWAVAASLGPFGYYPQASDCCGRAGIEWGLECDLVEAEAIACNHLVSMFEYWLQPVELWVD